MLKKLPPAILALLFSFPLFAQNYSVNLIPENLTKNTHAVVRKHAVRYEVPAQDKLETRISWAITVFDQDGMDYLGAYAYYNDGMRIGKIEALIFDRNGQEINKFRKKDFRDVSAVSGGTLYSDSRVLYLDYTPVSFPFTMEFTYEMVTPNTCFLPSHSFLLGYDIGTEFSEYELVYNPELEAPRVREKNLEGVSIDKEVSAGRVYYSVKNLPAINREDLSPGFSRVVPGVHAVMNQFHLEGKDGYATNWKELGSWMYSQILKNRQELPAETINEIKDLTRGVDDIYEKSKIVYNYVQEQTRYISVQVGIGGIQPVAAIDVDEVKYGDCKGLTNYTIALLQAVGVEAYYVHVESGASMESFPEDFASLVAGDHVILAIPYQGGYIWSDCTSKIHPFGFVGDFTDNRNVMVITPEGGELVKTVAYLDQDNKLTTTAEARLSSDGALQATVELTAEGIEYDRYFSKWEHLRDDSDMKEWYAEFWSYLNGFHLDAYTHEDNKDEVVLKEHLELGVKNYMSQAGDHRLFHLNAFNRKVGLPDRYRNRKLPFQITRGYLKEDVYTFHLPEGYRVESLPESKHLETAFGTYTTTCEAVDPKTILFKRSFLLKNGVYAKDQYDDYREFLKGVRSGDQSKVLLVPDGELAEK